MVWFVHCSNGLFVGDLFTISEQGVSGVSIYRVFTVKCEKSTVLKILTQAIDQTSVRYWSLKTWMCLPALKPIKTMRRID